VQYEQITMHNNRSIADT